MLLATVVLLCPHPAVAQAREYEVKAAFLLNFAKFVEWPAEAFASPHAPIVLAVAGEDPFGHALERLVQGRTAQGRGFAVRRFGDPHGAEPCHILFIAGSEKAGDWLAALQRRQAGGVLTVGEGRDFFRRGAISLVIEKRRVRFTVNLDAIGEARLRVSSRLLSLAHVVHPRRQEVGR